VLDAERDANLVLGALLDGQGGLLGSVDLGLSVELERSGLVVLLEDDGELGNHDTARIVLGRNIVGVNAYKEQEVRKSNKKGKQELRDIAGPSPPRQVWSKEPRITPNTIV